MSLFPPYSNDFQLKNHIVVLGVPQSIGVFPSVILFQFYYIFVVTRMPQILGCCQISFDLKGAVNKKDWQTLPNGKV